MPVLPKKWMGVFVALTLAQSSSIYGDESKMPSMQEDFESEIFTPERPWAVNQGNAKVEAGALTISGDGEKATAVSLNLTPSQKISPFLIQFDLKAASNVGFGRFDVELIDAKSGKRYMAILTASSKYFGDSTGYWDQVTLGKAGGFLAPGVTHLVRLGVDATTGVATLEVDGEVVLTQESFNKQVGLEEISSIKISVSGAAPWKVDNLSISNETIATSPDIAALKIRQQKESAMESLSQVKEQIKQLERVVGKDLPPINPENLSWIEVTREECLAKGYDREVKYWDVRKQLSEEKLEMLKLKLEALEDNAAADPVPADVQRRLEDLEDKVGSRVLDSETKAAIERVDKALASLNLDFSWHRVKVQLLRDLVNRAHRAAFYQGSPGTSEKSTKVNWTLVSGDQSDFAKEIDRLIEQDRQWENEYGECFFGSKELSLQGSNAAAGEKIAARAEALVNKLERADAERTLLEKKVLNFLATISPDGDFKDLGIPYREKNVKISKEGKTSELLFSSLGFGYPYTDIGIEAPLCVDVLDLEFYGYTMKARGVVTDVNPEKVAMAKKLAAEDGYFFKQPVVLNSYFRASTYRDTNLLPEGERNDPEFLLQDSEGKPVEMANIWHPKIRALLDENLVAVAEYSKATIPNLLMYEKLAWEGSALGNFTDVYGYNRQALDEFRASLKEKYADIGKLNEAWRTSYASFDAITPPPSPFKKGDYTPDALTYEFHVFRMNSWSRFQDDAIRSLQKGDPGRPVGTEFNGIGGSFVNGTVPSNRLWKASPATFVEDHHNNWLANYAALNMGYSLCLYAGKQPIETEYIWSYPRVIEPETEDDFRVTGELSVWRKMVWGRKILQFYAPQSGWQYNHGYLDERHSCVHQPEKFFGPGATGAFVRDAATSLVVGKKRAREFWPYLRDTEVKKPKIAIIVPTTSMINEYPFEVLSVTYPVYTRSFLRWNRLLTERDYDFRYVPEEAIVDGDENLEGFTVIVLPYMTYFPEGLSQRLLAWTEAGGTLIAEGVAGVKNAFGFDTPEMMQKLFNNSVTWKYDGQVGRGTNWRWDLSVASDATGVEVKVRKEGKALVLASKYGNGAVLLSGESFNSFFHKGVDPLAVGYAFAMPDKASVMAGDPEMMEVLYKTLSQAVPVPTAVSGQHKLELVVRESKDGQKYLFVTNAQLRDTLTDTVTLDGKYRHVYDLGIGPSYTVPLAKDSAAQQTAFNVRLAPGEATCFKLVP